MLQVTSSQVMMSGAGGQGTMLSPALGSGRNWEKRGSLHFLPTADSTQFSPCRKIVLLATVLGKVIGEGGNLFLMMANRYVLSRILPIFPASLGPVKVFGSDRCSAVAVQTRSEDK